MTNDVATKTVAVAKQLSEQPVPLGDELDILHEQFKAACERAERYKAALAIAVEALEMIKTQSPGWTAEIYCTVKLAAIKRIIEPGEVP